MTLGELTLTMKSPRFSAILKAPGLNPEGIPTDPLGTVIVETVGTVVVVVTKRLPVTVVGFGLVIVKPEGRLELETVLG